jgi:hypothetical protein
MAADKRRSSSTRCDCGKTLAPFLKALACKRVALDVSLTRLPSPFPTRSPGSHCSGRMVKIEVTGLRVPIAPSTRTWLLLTWTSHL